MITTDFAAGAPCWMDLGVPDIAAASDFYGAVFGWEFQSYGDEAGGYGVLRQDGKIVAAIGKLTEEGARPSWMIYFKTPDADAATQAVERAGGTVRVAPMNADGEGKMAQFSDPLGGQFAVWQPGTHAGLEAVDAPGTLCWTELFTTDVPAAKQFYGRVLGWHTDDMPMPGGGGTYTLIAPAGSGEERQQGGMVEMPREQLAPVDHPYWHPVFAVNDCDATTAKVTERGGTVRMGPQDMEGVGRLAVCLDPFGAEFVLLTPAEM